MATLVAEETSAPKPNDPIIARVDGETITQRELDRELAPATRLLDPQAALPPEVTQRALAQLIDRRLVVKYLTRQQLAASDQEIDLEIGRLKTRLKAQEKKLAEHLQALGMSEEELRREIRWRLSWARYLNDRLTDENLQKYFEKHRRQFDGTELRVAHLLLKTNADDPQAMEAAKAKAAAIRAEIEAGKVTFADACREHSQAPTANNGGDIGFIRRGEPMPEAFSAAAFAQEKGQVSEPVPTKFGIHLIQVLEEKPGQKTWQDCRRELRAGVTQYLFQWIAERERETAKIETNLAH
jgi:parvulin-like peptidyl-prolyl isomerase